METTHTIRPDMPIGDVIGQFPETLELIYHLFGGGCFTCPMYRVETLAQAAAAHGLDPQAVVARLQEAVQEARQQHPAPSITADMTVNDVLTAYPATWEVFSRLELAHAQGDLTISQAAQLKGRDVAALLDELRAMASVAGG